MNENKNPFLDSLTFKVLEKVVLFLFQKKFGSFLKRHDVFKKAVYRFLLILFDFK